jgi:cyclic pyranopterin phosphate synthase
MFAFASKSRPRSPAKAKSEIENRKSFPSGYNHQPMRLPVVPSSSAPASHFDTGPQSIAAVKVLRISITDRCNFRCLYCMPEEGVRWLPKEDILSFEEIADVVRAAVEHHGIRRFKLTGGEPTVRHGLVDLVRLLRAVPGVQDLSLTTNGQLLEHLAQPLKEAGLDRLTVSLDSLRPERFQRITRTGDLAAVLCGLDRATAVGFTATKINCVTMRGTNDDEFPEFARLTLSRPITVRFIEYMPLGDAALMDQDEMGVVPDPSSHSSNNAIFPLTSPAPLLRISDTEQGPQGGCGAQDRGKNAFISEPEVRERIETVLGPLVPVDRGVEAGVGPANVYCLSQGNPQGRLGFISAMSAPFCATCNRLRLTANGILRSCLFDGGEVDIRPLLRDNQLASHQRPGAIAHAMAECVRLKPITHSGHGNQQMSRIGG